MKKISHVIELPELKKQDNSFHFEASPEECGFLAKTLDISDIKDFKAQVVLRKNFGTYDVSGKVACCIEQVSVVSLEKFWSPFEFSFSETFKIGREEAPSNREEVEVGDVTFCEDGSLDLWQLLIEYMSLNLDAFPKKPGETFSYQEFNPSENSPFTILKEKF